MRCACQMYQMLLYLYPPDFRRSYGALMLQLFVDEHNDARNTDSVLRFWLRTLGDLALNVPRQHILYILRRKGMRTTMLKRAFDIGFALVALAILVVLTPFIALALALDSPGGVFYVARRIGRNGKPFRMYKFRTMTADAPHRVTRVGAVLRRTYLDEWPQFWNVLIGDMSIIGPRPDPPDVVPHADLVQHSILSVRPGLSGLAQVRVIESGGPLDHAARQELDAYYVARHSVTFDLKLLARHFIALSRRK